VTQSLSSSNITFGFLTVVDVAQLGHCGGLLIVSNIGRPIEFHCTTPVSANRTQEIMYGKTYAGFLYADQIGMSLVDKARKTPSIFVTDCPDMLPISELIDTPLILIDNPNGANAFDGRGLKRFTVDEQIVYAVNANAQQMESLQEQVGSFASRLPLEEPFERVCQAIEEAHTVLRSA
jgi:hypothetical protein